MNKSGIYTITNLINGKRYVGSAVNLRKRLNNHRFALRLNTHHSTALQSAWNKYGEQSFAFSVLFLCDKHALIMFEQRSMDILHPRYNMAPMAGNALGVKWTEESKARRSDLMKGNTSHLGHLHSQATKDIMRAKKLGGTLTAEHKAKIGTKSKGNKHRLGVRHPEAFKKHMSALLTGRVHTWGDKISAARKGMKFSAEHLANMSLATKKMWQDPEFRKKYYTSRGLTVPPYLLLHPSPGSIDSSVRQSVSPSA